MRFNKRALSLLVAVCMLVSLLPASLLSASAIDVGTVYSYKIADVAVKLGNAQVPSYQASQDANVGSAEWMYYSSSNSYLAASSAPYYVFALNNKGGAESFTLKINVPEDGIYDATWNYYEYGSTAPVDVYLTPVSMANEQFLMNIAKTGNTGNQSATAPSVALLAGDYYLTVKQIPSFSGDDSNRYWNPLSFDLEYTGEYDPTAITAVSFDKANVVLGMDGIDFITPSVLPAEADDGSVVYTWESSDENVVIVDEGLIMPIGPGFATVKATTENGKFATANVLITEDTNFEYNFTKGWKGSSSQNAAAITAMGYAQTMKGSPSEISCANGYVETAPWAFEKFLSAGTTASVTTSFPIGKAQSTIDCRGYTIVAKDDGGVSFRIAVPTEGEYSLSADISKGSGYGNATFYLAPADAVNPVADDYALCDEMSLHSAALADHTIVEFGNKELTAGEYIVSVKGVINALFWRSFILTNPNAVKEVSIARDTLNVAVGETVTLGATVLPETAPDKTLTWSSDSECVSVDAETGAITGVSEGTATITAAAVADETKVDTITVTVGGKVFYYDFMKSADFMAKPGYRDDKYLKDSAYAQDFKYIKAGSPDEVGLGHESYAWKIGPTVNSSDWTWSQSAESLGLFVNLMNVTEDGNGETVTNGYASINIDVPVAGTYDLISVHSLWTGGSTADYYLAPVTAENPIAAEYKVNTAPVNHKTDNGENYTTEVVVGTTAALDAGEYVLTFYTEVASPIFVRGIRLSDATVNVPVETITLNRSGTVSIVDGETLAVTATVLPANASDKTYTLTSSNESVAKVVDGAVVPVGAGIATITATANDGSGVSASFDVMCNMTLKYTYDFRSTLAPLYNLDGKKANVSATTNAFSESYAASIAAGSAPWMYYGSSTGYEYFDYTSSSHGGFGTFGMNANAVGFYNTVKIRVDEGAKYTGVLKVSDWTGSNNFDIYIAPVHATDIVADEYKVGSYAITGGTEHGYDVPLSTIDMPAGDYYVSFKITKVNGGTLIGLFDLKLYYSGALAAAESVTLNASTVDGASIRTSGNQGLRFVSSLEKTADFDKVVEYGTILMPTEYLNGDSNNLVIGYKAGQKKAVAKVPAVFLYTDTETEVSFTAVLTNIAAANYTREISARAYAIYEDANGNQYVVYGSTVTSRSPYTVAKNGLADENASEEDKAIFQAIVDAVEGAQA